jgi:hypothetical protein
MFDTTLGGWTNLLNVTNSITHPRSYRNDGKTLLPSPHPMHKNLADRWLWYLDPTHAGPPYYTLTQQNHNAIADAIHDALTDTTFQCITFEAVEIGGAQSVVANDVMSASGTKYKQIVLRVTTGQAMPTAPVIGNQPPNID